MAQVDYFLKFDGIKGESADAKHKDEIDVESWSWGETQALGHGGGGGGGAGKVQMQDFSFMMRENRASIDLMKACAAGQHIKDATLSARKAGKDQQDYLTIKFQEVLISSFQTGAADEVPQEQVSFNFATIDIMYKPQKADGSLDAGIHFKYDIKSNKEF